MNRNTKKDGLAQRLRNLTKQELSNRDVFGRAIIHIICILGRFDLLESLLDNPNLNLSMTDYESAWTGLHHALFYGKLSCARLLLQKNFDIIKIKDRNGLTAMDIYHLEYSYENFKIYPLSIGENDTNYIPRLTGDAKLYNSTWWNPDERGGSAVYTFGVNVNNQLGTGDTDDRLKVPHRVEILSSRRHDEHLSISDRLVKPRIKDIKLSKTHAIILTNEITMNCLIAGNPSRGRLGNGSSLPNYKFTPIDYFADEHITQIAISEDHSLALTQNGDVYSWGLNNFYQLGYSTESLKDRADSYSSGPRKVSHVLKKLRIRGVSCSKIHSAAYTSNVLITWGLNVGQMDCVSTGPLIKTGKFKGIVQQPRKLEFPSEIIQVIATDDSTIILLQTYECHILTSGNHLRFQLPQYKSLNNEFDFFRPAIYSKRRTIQKLVSKDSSKIGILYNDGSVSEFGVDMFSKSSNIKYSTIWNPRNDHLKCADVDIGADGSIVICTKSGCVFKKAARSSGKSDFKFTKIEKLSRIVKVSCDPLFASFGFVKDDIDLLPVELMENRFKLDMCYLLPIYAAEQRRKQEELIQIDNGKYYSFNFLNKPDFDLKDDTEHFGILKTFEVEEVKTISTDPLYTRYIRRWNQKQSLKDTFQTLDEDRIMNYLLRKDLKYQLNTLDNYSGKGYDLNFNVDDCYLGVHESVLCFAEKFQSIREHDVVIGDAVFHKADHNNVIKIENVSIHTILVMLTLLYTGKLFKIWESETTDFFCNVKKQSLSLLKGLNLVDDFGRNTINVNSKFQNLNNFKDDVTISLKDGEEVRCCSYILRARNAYFETFLSQKWDIRNEMKFEHVDKKVFNIALKYIYGHEQLSLLDACHDIDDSTDLINLLLELIELSDEILLFGLKELCESIIKDFIGSENVLLILHHADILNCNKLIGECLWFIYNNIECYLFDSTYHQLLPDTIITRIDRYCCWLNKANNYKFCDKDYTAWYDKHSDETVRKFLGNIEQFNSFFLNDNAFEPLFDMKPKKKQTNKQSTKSEQRRTSSPTILSSVIGENQGVELKPKPLSNSFVNNLRTLNIAEGSVVDDIDDDGFQPVVNRRRKSSAAARRPSPIMTVPKITPTKSSIVPHSASSTPHPSWSNSGDISNNNWPELERATPPSGVTNIPSTSYWASGKTEPSSSLSKPLSVPSSTKTHWPEITETSPSPTAKVIFSTTKISQKERRKMMKSSASEVINTPSKPAWKTAKFTTTPSSTTATATGSMSNSLLAAREEAYNAEFSPIPSLAGIIHEEEHRIMEEKRTKTKSLAEIQQEEEFASWWEAESHKVQEQMGILNSNNKQSNGMCGNGHSKRQQKRRLSSRNKQRTSVS